MPAGLDNSVAGDAGTELMTLRSEWASSRQW